MEVVGSHRVEVGNVALIVVGGPVGMVASRMGELLGLGSRFVDLGNLAGNLGLLLGGEVLFLPLSLLDGRVGVLLKSLLFGLELSLGGFGLSVDLVESLVEFG